MPFVERQRRTYLCPEEENHSLGEIDEGFNEALCWSTYTLSHVCQEMKFDVNDPYTNRNDLGNGTFEMLFDDFQYGDTADLTLRFEPAVGGYNVTVIENDFHPAHGVAIYGPPDGSVDERYVGRTLDAHIPATSNLPHPSGPLLWEVDTGNHAGEGDTFFFPWSGAGQSDYGINNRVHRFGTDSDRILCVEYRAYIANVVGQDAGDDWAAMVAPRHLGTLNVLFGDGHVESRNADQIDPRVQSLHDSLWMPKNDSF